MSHTIDDLLVLSRTGEREGQGEAVDLAEAVARRAPALGARRGRRATIALHAEPDGGGHGLGLARRPRPRRRRGRRERDPLHARGRARDRPRRRPRRSRCSTTAPASRPARRTTSSPASTAAAPAAAGAPGTGLGLPIARELMRAWGGDATLANRPEGGTRATLTARPLPALSRRASYRGPDA